MDEFEQRIFIALLPQLYDKELEDNTEKMKDIGARLNRFDCWREWAERYFDFCEQKWNNAGRPSEMEIRTPDEKLASWMKPTEWHGPPQGWIAARQDLEMERDKLLATWAEDFGHDAANIARRIANGAAR